MITVEEALERILSHIHPLGSEKVPLLEALGRVIAEDIYSRGDIPALDNSAMDGYAVKWTDIKKASLTHPVRLDVIETVPAGSVSKKTLKNGQAIRMMTGAPLPKGADTIVPLEDTTMEGDLVSVLKGVGPGEHVRKAGEDVRKGEQVIFSGDLIGPAMVGMLASLGRSMVTVYQRPSVAILCTGDELVDVDEAMEEAKIVSSNSYALAAQVKECGAIPIQLGIARDHQEEIKTRLSQGLRADILLSSAGVSVGDYDFVKESFTDLGMEMVFWKVAMKPGKPLVFGTIKGKPVFGLPGNPGASMISFEQFVRPSLLKMMGHRQILRPLVHAILKGDIRKAPGRRHFIQASLTYEKGRYFAHMVSAQGSGILRSMLKTNGLIIVPEDREFVKAGEKVRVQLLDRNY